MLRRAGRSAWGPGWHGALGPGCSPSPHRQPPGLPGLSAQMRVRPPEGAGWHPLCRSGGRARSLLGALGRPQGAEGGRGAAAVAGTEGRRPRLAALRRAGVRSGQRGEGGGQREGPVREALVLGSGLHPGVGVEQEVEQAWGSGGLRQTREAGSPEPLPVCVQPGEQESEGGLLALAQVSSRGLALGLPRRAIPGEGTRPSRLLAWGMGGGGGAGSTSGYGWRSQTASPPAWPRDLAAGAGDHRRAGGHCQRDGHRLHVRVHPQSGLQVPLRPVPAGRPPFSRVRGAATQPLGGGGGLKLSRDPWGNGPTTAQQGEPGEGSVLPILPLPCPADPGPEPGVLTGTPVGDSGPEPAVS